MTILPKKKTTKDKNDPESTDHTHHPSTSDSRHEKVNRSRNSPTRWLPTTSREEKITGHDPGGNFDGLETPANHNKRRHRSSPHRGVRKHRGHSSSSSHTSMSSATAAATEYDETGYNSEDEYTCPSYPDNIDELERWFEQTLKEKKGFIIKKMGEDGACLFRAVADQVYGDQEMHSVVRKHCVDYMAKNADYYSHYVTEDFTTYLNRKKMDSCHGNHVEMQAICEMFNRPIQVYQYSLEPINTFNCSYTTEDTPIRISYHRNVHYNSIVDPCKASIGVGLGLPGLHPGLADKNLIGDAVKQSENTHIEQCMLEDKIRETDWEVTQESIEEQVARESYLQWLKDNEKRNTRRTSPRSASATCSSSCDNMLMESVASPDHRLVRSPRNRSTPNSAQNSPQRVDMLVSQDSPRPTLSCAGFTEWDEDDILAQVMAQSQQEYLDSLKKNASSSSSTSSSSQTTSSLSDCTSSCSSSQQDTNS
ncbi:hypothetical protein KUTeg_020663 [Tegillarca granosa]|uniref:ubiquitinyl hydrolase 1 n=1 Tax=Tegillarca granosa TaxID=220873 RepID=A0ABQ9ECY5_TEGGR|nr:hypothetical protein KUTeg_020663 [Tegillarca granosa]